MTEFAAGLTFALRNLSAKATGDDVEWINIADARLLTELGYAARSRQGLDHHACWPRQAR